MIPSAVGLDTTDFDALVDLARARLPAKAPQWTDYNYHDPGITLIDLFAFVADTQVYSLSRNRRDERRAMAALLGVTPKRAQAATGVLSPSPGGSDWLAEHRRVAAGLRLSALRATAPRLRTTHEVDLVPWTIEAVAREEARQITDLTAANERPLTSFAPFGAPTNLKTALRITLRGEPGWRKDIRLSLGIRVESEGEVDGSLGGIAVAYRREDGKEVALDTDTGVQDTSGGLQRNGALMVRLAGDDLNASGVHHIVLRPAPPGAQLPRLMQITVNALPVDQQVLVSPGPLSGNGRPGQVLTLIPSELLDEIDRTDGAVWHIVHDPALSLIVDSEPWQERNPDEADPGARVFVLTEKEDGTRIELHFGNGINGARLPAQAAVEVKLGLSRGAGGNVAAGLEWQLEGQGLFFFNAAPIHGGQNPSTVADLLDEARRRLSGDRALATAADIEQAALGLPPAFAVERATVVEGWEPGGCAILSDRTRTLVVSRRLLGGEATESSPWLRAVRNRIAPRLDLGERLVVVGPRYVDLAISAHIRTARGRQPDAVRAAVEKELQDRLHPGGARGRTWPVGRAVSLAAVEGWIRRVPGVVDVDHFSVRPVGRQAEAGIVRLDRDELPRPSEIIITAGSMDGTR